MVHYFTFERAGTPQEPPAPKFIFRAPFSRNNEEDDDEDEDQPDNSKTKLRNKPKENEAAEDQEEEEEEEEEDYMNMTFTDAPSQPETSLQRRQRLQKEGQRRGMVPSKAQLAEQERERRKEGLSKSLLTSDPVADEGILVGEKITAERRQKAEAEQQQNMTKSKGLAIMAKMGFMPGSGLGRTDGKGMVEPLKIEVREDRGGLGLDKERKRKLLEALDVVGEDEESANEEGGGGGGGGNRKKKKVADEGDYRERMAKERENARKEKLVLAMQKIAERMDDDQRLKALNGSVLCRPLKCQPVLYRGIVKQRMEAERDRRARHDLESSSAFPNKAKLPTYTIDDDDMDAYDRIALGKEDADEEYEEERDVNSVVKTKGSEEAKAGSVNSAKGGRQGKSELHVFEGDMDEEDDELATFNELDVDKRMAMLVAFLREDFQYCFWCKMVYPDEEMKGCPGETEEEHD